MAQSVVINLDAGGEIAESGMMRPSHASARYKVLATIKHGGVVCVAMLLARDFAYAGTLARRN